MVTGILYGDTVATAIVRLQAWLDDRPEACTDGVEVSNSASSAAMPSVTVVSGPGLGAVDTLDDTTLRVNVRHTDEADASDLARLVRAWADFFLADGKPVTRARTTAGPTAVPSEGPPYQWYMVVNVTQRGTPLT